MPTVGSAHIELSANSAEFARDMDRITREWMQTSQAIRRGSATTSRGMGAVGVAAGRLSRAFAPLAVAAGALAGVTGLGAIAVSAVRTATTLTQVSTAIGINTTALQEYRFAASQAGFAAEELDDSFLTFSGLIGEARFGAGTLATDLRELNPELLRQIRNTTSAEEAIRLYIRALTSTSNEQDRAALSIIGFGDAGERMSGIFRDGGTALAEARKRAREFGLVLSDEAIQSTTEMGKAFDLMTSAAEAFADRLVAAIAPAFKWGFEQSAKLLGLANNAADGARFRIPASPAGRYDAINDTREEIESLRKQRELRKQIADAAPRRRAGSRRHHHRFNYILNPGSTGVEAESAKNDVREITGKIAKLENRIVSLQRAQIQHEADGPFRESLTFGRTGRSLFDKFVSEQDYKNSLILLDDIDKKVRETAKEINIAGTDTVRLGILRNIFEEEARLTKSIADRAAAEKAASDARTAQLNKDIALTEKYTSAVMAARVEVDYASEYGTNASPTRRISDHLKDIFDGLRVLNPGPLNTHNAAIREVEGRYASLFNTINTGRAQLFKESPFGDMYGSMFSPLFDDLEEAAERRKNEELAFLGADFVRDINAYAAKIRAVEQITNPIVSNLKTGLMEFSSEAARSFGNVIRGTESIGDAFARLSDRITDILLDAALFKPLETAFGNLFNFRGSAHHPTFTDGLFGFKLPGISGPSGLFANVGDPLGGLLGFASGGRPPTGQPVIVGERGPELVTFGSPARVHNASATAQMMYDRPRMSAATVRGPSNGSSSRHGRTTNVFNIDARGASLEAVQEVRRMVYELSATVEPRALAAVRNHNTRRTDAGRL